MTKDQIEIGMYILESFEHFSVIDWFIEAEHDNEKEKNFTQIRKTVTLRDESLLNDSLIFNIERRKNQLNSL